MRPLSLNPKSSDAETRELCDPNSLESKTCNHQQEEDRKKETVGKFQRCHFCGAKLFFTHDLDLTHLQVTESSRCGGCGVSMKPQLFTLH